MLIDLRMKTIMKTALLLAVLCLTGCKGEDPQSVKFLSNELDAVDYGCNISLSITANCPWRITENSDLVELDQMQGTGDATINGRLLPNTGYDAFAHQITVTSQDGTSSDLCTINQGPAIKVEISEIDMISEEGGTFSMPVQTNDVIKKVQTSEWITFVSSRGLTGYTYTFTAESNKTGKQREGYVWIEGETGFYDSVSVMQDSYAPTSVTVEDFPAYVTTNGFWRFISAEPEYADLSKLEISFPEAGYAKIDKYDDYLINVFMNEYGKYPIRIYAGKDILFQAAPEYLPRYPFSYAGLDEAYLGQNDGIVQWIYQSSLYTLESSDISVIRVVDNRKFEAVGIGTAAISAGIPGTEIHSTCTIRVENFAAKVNVGQIKQLEDGSYDVTFSAMIKGPKGFGISDCTIKDNAGNAIFKSEGTIKQAGPDGYTINTPETNIDFDREAYNSINSLLGGYKFLVTVEINGNKFQREIYVDGYTVSEF